MTDTEADILKAFIAALTQQKEPLPTDVQKELNSLGKTLNTDELDTIAKKYPPLLNSYEKAHKLLVEKSSTRNKGKDFVPDSRSEKDNTNNTEIDNLSSDIQDLKSLQKILAKIEEEIERENNLATLLSKIFNASNAVQSAQDIFPLI
ncbi:hypothetical protein [Phormidium nigroviride]